FRSQRELDGFAGREGGDGGDHGSHAVELTGQGRKAVQLLGSGERRCLAEGAERYDPDAARVDHPSRVSSEELVVDAQVRVEGGGDRGDDASPVDLHVVLLSVPVVSGLSDSSCCNFRSMNSRLLFTCCSMRRRACRGSPSRMAPAMAVCCSRANSVGLRCRVMILMRVILTLRRSMCSSRTGLRDSSATSAWNELSVSMWREASSRGASAMARSCA